MAIRRARGAGKHRAPRTSTRPKASTAAGPRKRGFFRRFWWVFLAVPFVLFLALAGTLIYVYAHLKVPAAPPGPQTTYVYDRHGHVITTLHAAVDRTEMPLSAISPNLQHAVIAVEDRNFYHEGGISPVAIVRAAWQDVTHQGIVQGGSTITQQYVKNVYTGDERSFSRKIKEAMLAVKLSHQYSKNEVLEKYLNTVYLGHGAYGAQAAAETYYGIPASQLDVLQSATIAGLIQAPSLYDPYRNPDGAKGRRDTVLDVMAEQHYISEAQAATLKALPVKLRKETTQVTAAPYFVSYVSRQLQRQFGYAETFTGGLRVTTTLDLPMQRAADAAIRSHLAMPGDPSAALVAIDPTTGAIRAMVGGKSFAQSQFNLATDGDGRQAGSAFKPFTLTAAMEDKISLNSTWNGPPQITIHDPKCNNPDGTPWMLSNSADEAAGTMSLLNATAFSVNTIFAQVVTQVTPEAVADVAHRMGITSPLHPVCSITLGTQLVHPLEMADGYATLAARGVHHDATPLSAVKAPNGDVLARATTAGDPVLARNDADLVTYALQRVIAYGTGTAADIGTRPVAGKTGTAQEYKDAWFCGYTPQLATCVWVGFPKSERPMTNIEGFPAVFGGTIPALIWHDFMSEATSNMPVKEFAKPSFAGFNVTPSGSVPSPSPLPTQTTPSPTPTTPSPSPTTPSPSPTTGPAPAAPLRPARGGPV